MRTKPLFGTSSSQLMERLLSQALMILQFRWEGGCPPNGCNADSNKGTLWLWLKSSTCLNFQMSLGFLLDYAHGHKWNPFCFVFFCAWGRQFGLEPSTRRLFTLSIKHSFEFSHLYWCLDLCQYTSCHIYVISVYFSLH